ncbi:ribonucleoside-diphosphate reductase, adenosylcobalamin-dependent [Candidatus Woesebacteria bacterium RIFCSPLOWO2_01_FULL_39_61]|uniref:Vitamin B12-dependent ribonucleotide reductase n=1 Tax=Candidatus Woesebacteria bacterium RIFCSPHIGHO2_02_FULL_39_13 TaxID=1802505 RepID=A0A1F7Z324_9BACT|nr:MAG: ribonucleoside-diphosphate reductase, adenosylcobalamin-dependent [Candidatus Woesebacteria bacterium RIFCSPHIGHO2_01_FULL_39_95]OGM33931.1 MAG: ribonucleoside-diphosphate reductase, adenosylcobalamin-dependent [Candidatus Woesebacteria bacterium RIFCSPHIGHO2_02_FULL_39_13]OGM37220.1 MAG: ribonucleoside-diphosphate reductase, adenosylcobalamin-dependent [Candidatus Woesebacteria bacterium RIFCSPHIGHO2_12_FULL_40_20]OGM65905.1 MAG: ribonucleoside-diphosphate reductase, adenosylcobalamin-d
MIKAKSKNKKKNGSKNLSLESLQFPSYEEIKKDIFTKIGEKPSLPDDLPAGVWTEQSLKVLTERYLKKDDLGNIIETPEEMCWRVAWDIASAEVRWGKGKTEITKIAREFYQLLVSHDFLPNSPTLMNAGTDNGLQYSACFVLPVEDSLVGIFDAIKYQALIHQTGGGTGFAFSRLRPQGSVVRSSRGTASGPVSFMRIFDAATNEIKQGGKRRGANMGILRVDHPDIMEFIHCKEEGGITNFNISVAVTDVFMEAYKRGSDYDLIDPHNGKVVGKLNARSVFDEIADGAWKTGDPGLVFIDRVNAGSANPVPSLGPVESTNPCGEQPLYPYDSCNLGSIFLTYFVKATDGKKEVDWEKLRKATRLSTRFLDNVIEMNPYPLESIRKISLAIRRIGLGVGGWADMLIELGIPYDSREALKLGEKIMKVIQEEAVDASKNLAKERGPFPMWPVSTYKNQEPRRNSTVTTIAPTGTISIIAGASSGIEPIFALAYQHIVKDKHLDRTLSFINPKFEEVAKQRGFWSEGIKDKVVEHGVIRGINEVPEDVRQVFGTAHEIHHDWHIKHQAVFQKYTENAVSKTINMANSIKVNDIKKAYLLAWETDCKGITVFRDGCKETQVLNLGVKDKEKDVFQEAKDPTLIRPFVVRGSTYRLETPVGRAFVTINQDESGEPLEVFINVGKAGSDVTAMAEALGRTISTSLRFRGHLAPREKAKEIALQLSGIGGRRSVGFGSRKILSLPDAVAAAISTHFGFKINGYQAGFAGDSSFLNLKKAIDGSGKILTVEAQSDSAGAVMSAQISGVMPDTSPLGSDDHTMASAESHLASTQSDSTSTELDSSTALFESTPTNGNGLEESFTTQLSLTSPKVSGDICPSCGASALVNEEGCSKCHVCGYSEC